MQKIFLFVLVLFSSACLAGNYDGLEQLIADMDVVGVQSFIDQVEDKADLKKYFNRIEQPILEYFFSLPSMGGKNGGDAFDFVILWG
ncbi:hypothetical protein [Endozoicomonas sp. Mp262]|uniref:hypothetical protein n=1 Tax=Endozoicomonas sp. Mp262 TaxID=2919499 RepID=UPI0021DB2ABF